MVDTLWACLEQGLFSNIFVKKQDMTSLVHSGQFFREGYQESHPQIKVFPLPPFPYLFTISTNKEQC